MREYSLKSFDHLLHLPGFTEQAMRTHLALYEGYVNNTNLLAELMRESLEAGTSGRIQWAEMKRRFAWEFNGMRLHEYYFENLTPTPKPLSASSWLYGKIEQDFGLYDLWERGIQDTARIRGAGWVLLALDIQTGRLFNTWLDEHDSGLMVDARPLLVMDVFEHAFLLDYGLKRNEYVEAVFQVIDWDVVEARMAVCVTQQHAAVGGPLSVRSHGLHDLEQERKAG